MKKIILLLAFVLCVPQLSLAEDSLMDLATSPVRSAPPAPVVEKALVKEEVTTAQPKKKQVKKVSPKKKAPPQSMIRKKEEIGHGSMFREKKPEKSKETVKHYAPVSGDQDCQYLTAYQPGVDGDAEYKPGVDTEGKPVAAADMNTSVISPPKKIEFDLTVDMAKYMGITSPTGFEGKADMGKISVENGQIKFNGKSLESDAEAKLKAFCAKKAK